MSAPPLLRLGIVGLSAGNGHPYSWSAICNGYDRTAMAQCPFPGIPRYLAQQRFPAAQLPDARVTHIWTQDPVISQQVARAALIPNVVTDLEVLSREVDGILLARDDAENHLRFAQPFIAAGLPIYIDKPLALSRRAALELLDMARFPGQVFSCSALRYALELQMTTAQHARVGTPRLVEGNVPSDWEKYAVHVIEPVLAQWNPSTQPESVQRTRRGAATEVWISWPGEPNMRFTSTGTAGAPIEITIHGSEGSVRLRFRRAFPAFRAALAAFVRGAREHRAIIAREETLRVVDVIEAGCQAN